MCLYLKYFKCTGWHAFSPPAGWITQLHDSMSQIGFDDIVTEVDAWLADGSPASSSRTELGETLVAGFLNPKLAVFFAALFSQFITPERMNFSSGALMAGTVLAIDTIWYIIVAGLVHGTRERFALAEKGPLIDKIAGVVFIALSIRVVTL